MGASCASSAVNCRVALEPKAKAGVLWQPKAVLAQCTPPSHFGKSNHTNLVKICNKVRNLRGDV